MRRTTLGAAAFALLLGATHTASAGVVYDNGPVENAGNAWLIGQGQEVADSFTLAGPTMLTRVEIGLWLLAGDGDAAIGLDWEIGTSAYRSDVASGSGLLDSTFLDQNTPGYGVYDATFSALATLGAGTYWLTLRDGTSQLGQFVYWYEDDGRSSAVDSDIAGPVGSESFRIEGTAVPEPAGLVLMGLGFVGPLGYRRGRSGGLARPEGSRH